MRNYDVTILGGGLAGLTLALQLTDAVPGISIAIAEKREHPLPEAAHKVGESTVEAAAHYFGTVLSLEEHLKELQLPKYGLRYFFSGDGEKRLEQRVEMGTTRYLPRGSYQIDRGRFENFLAKRCLERGVAFEDGSRVTDVTLGEDGAAHVISVTRGSAKETLGSKWLVDATSRTALLKRKLDLDADPGHRINAAWFRIGAELNIDDWCPRDPSWHAANGGVASRWLSTNHLMGEGYWVWVIPLASGSTSVGIVADPRFHPLDRMNDFEGALAWLDEHEPVCAREVRARADLLQDFLVLKHFSRGAKQVYSDKRWALTGDAGVFIDPLYSPGSDFIGFSNTFITSLVSADLRGKQIHGLASIYNDLFLGFAENTFRLYRDQYVLLGNPRVMPLKVSWDFAIYWSFFAYLFAHGRLCDVGLLGRVKSDLDWVSRMNDEMQDLFRRWHARGETRLPRAFVDLSSIEYFYGMNEALTLPAPDDFGAALSENIRRLTLLAHEIVEKARESDPELAPPPFAGEPMPHESRLAKIYPLLGL